MDGSADETPLFRAAERGWLDLVRVLLRAGASVHTRNHKGNTPLWIASCFRNDEVMVELLGAGADPNAPNAKGEVPLINRWAGSEGDEGVGGPPPNTHTYALTRTHAHTYISTV